MQGAEVVAALRTDAMRGLELDEVERRRALHGINTLPTGEGRGPWKILTDQFRSPLIYVLMGAAVATLTIGHVVDAVVITGVIAVNAAIGTIQEWRAGTALAALAALATGTARVTREGRAACVPSEELVVGDLVSLDAGDRVPADVRLIECHELRVDEASLTGESVPVHKSLGVLDPLTPLADRTCMCFAGCLVTAGRAQGVVVATGTDTQVGAIQALMTSADDLTTPLTRQLAHFSRVITIVILVLAALTFVLGLWRGESPAYMVTAAVALAVGTIPEGLPAVVTITLAIGVSRMARRRAIIRRLPAVETLGSVTVICTDKTGTLTEGRMTVQSVFCDGEWWPIGPGDVSPCVRDCLLAGVLCNDASLDPNESDGPSASRESPLPHRLDGVGDSLELALLAAALRAAPDVLEQAAAMERSREIPFSSELRLMATVHSSAAHGSAVLTVKGAAEEVLHLCRVDKSEGRVIAKAVDDAADEALRVVALASALVPTDRALDMESLRCTPLHFLGLVALQDPPRADAVKAVEACHRAGIEIRMVTGDHRRTAVAVARQVGILEGQVMARVTAGQKLDVVRDLQRGGDVVAMTGDGVNDAPALKQADIGVAMGRVGTEVAKEAADMVIVDDDFATIESAIEEGRTVFDNLLKYIAWTLPTNFAEGLVVLIAVGVNAALPILPLQILWINTLTAVALGVMLAFEPSEPGVMRRPPRPARRPLMSRRLVLHVGIMGVTMLTGVFAVFLLAQEWGMDLDAARTVAVNALVAMEIAYLFACRALGGSLRAVGAFSNPWVWLGVGITVALQLVLTYLPIMNGIFQTAPLDAQAGLLIAAAGLAVLGVALVVRRVLPD